MCPLKLPLTLSSGLNTCWNPPCIKNPRSDATLKCRNAHARHIFRAHVGTRTDAINQACIKTNTPRPRALMWSRISNVSFKVVSVCIYSVVGPNAETCKYFPRTGREVILGSLWHFPDHRRNTELSTEADAGIRR